MTIPDTRDRTAAILAAQASGRRLDPTVLAGWRSLDKFLERGSHHVVIPYVQTLGRLVPPVSLRLGRDFPSVLSLIRAHALLHRATRNYKGGAVQATFDDYRQVRRLVEPVLSQGLGRTVSQAVRDTVDAVPKSMTDRWSEGVTVKFIADKLEIDESAASRRVRMALDLGALRNLQRGRFRPAQLVRGERLPGRFRVLPTTKDLKAASKTDQRRG